MIIYYFNLQNGPRGGIQTFRFKLLPHDFVIPEKNLCIGFSIIYRNNTNKSNQEKRTLNRTSIVEEDVFTIIKNINIIIHLVIFKLLIYFIIKLIFILLNLENLNSKLKTSYSAFQNLTDQEKKNSSNLTTHLKLNNTETDKRLKDYFDNKKKSTKITGIFRKFNLINYMLLIYFLLFFKESMKIL